MIGIQLLNKQGLIGRLADEFRLGWGKLRRQYLLLFRPNYISQMQMRRIGSCNGCGVCCRLSWQCWHHRLPAETESGGCSRYSRRFLSCRLFPIDPRDLRDRDLLSPDVSCGFNFIAVEQAAREATIRAPVFVSIRPLLMLRRRAERPQEK